MGVGMAEDSYKLMRGIFQCLEHGLPEGHLRLHHVRSHAGDPYNEFVDWAAKQEAIKSFHHRQMPLDMQKWSKFLPHFWLVFGQHCGLPAWQDGQLITPCPTLPQARTTRSSTQHATEASATRCTLSIATANVLSLSKHPEGQRGKLHYLFAQMKHFGLNVIGLQECRSEEGHTTSNNVLRYMSGHRQGQEGVEIWINLDQPIAVNDQGKPCYLAAHHCQILWKDPRRLLLRVVSPFFDGWFFVAHAPHSGKPRDEREDWWKETTEILTETGAIGNCFWLIDANAEPGPADGATVFCKGLRTSASTILFRDCLSKLNMCLPSTSHIHIGDRDTWTRPDGSASFCIDHIAVPQEWKEFCTRSEVLCDLDLANSRCDHQAVGLELSWWQNSMIMPTLKSSPRIAWHETTTKDEVKRAMDKISVPAWNTDVETQEQHLSSEIAEILGGRQRESRKPKKCYIDEDIWESRRLMIHSQKRLKQLRQRLGREALWQVFNAWKTKRVSPLATEHFQYGTTLRCDTLLLLSKLRAQRRIIRHKLKMAKIKLMEKSLEQVNEHTAASSILHLLRGFIGPTNPKKQKKRTLPMLEKEDGTMSKTPEEALQVWIRFFADMEGGRRQTEDALHADWLQELQNDPKEPFLTMAETLPSLADLELAYRRVATGKATGPDQVPGELCHYAPKGCARATYASLWKLILFGHEALKYKGGLLIQAYKGKGPTTRCSSYRSLLISSHIGKSLHRAMRDSQATVFESFLQSQQLGGRRAMPVSYGVHLARAFHRQARHHGHSCAHIMLDLKEAFYRIFRPLCMDGQVTDQALAHLMRRLQMPADAMCELRRILGDPCALEQAGLTPQQQRSVRAVHSQTFFWMRHQQDVVQTKHGSRPGDPFADVIFSYVWAVVLKKLQVFMQQQGIISEFLRRPTLMLFDEECPDDGERAQFIGPTWMDDLCVCVEGGSPAQTIQRTTLVTGRLLELCLEHCMTPNLQPNKTEILFSLRGAESRRYKKDIYGTQATGCLPIVCEYGTYQVPVTSRYCHLGGILHHVADQQAEIKRRIAIANAAMSHHSKLVFRNWAIPLRKRVQLFEALILSKLLYGAETWVVTDDKTEKYFHAATIRLYRRLLPVSHDRHMHDLEVLSIVKLPSPIELVRRARLRYVATLLHSGQRQEWGLLERDKQWTQLVESDMHWLWKQLHHCSSLGEPKCHWPQWKELILNHRSYWRKLVRRASEHAILQRSNEWHLLHFHHIAIQGFRQFLDYEPNEQTDVQESQATFGCLFCRKRCRTRAGEAAHMFKVHKHQASRRRLVDSTGCPACLKEYHTMEKVTAHLYYSTRCRRILQSRNYACVPEPGTGSLQDRDLKQRHDRLLPPLRQEGPLPLEPRLRDDPGIDNELHVAIMEIFLESSTMHLAFDEIQRIVEERPISWTTWTRTLLYFEDTLAVEDVDKWEVTLQQVKDELRALLSPDRWGLEFQASSEVPDRCALERECNDIAVTDWQADWAIPRPFGRHRVFLHLFAGRRRRGDLQFYLDHMQPPSGYVLHVVSVDIVIDEIWGDATAEATRMYWLRKAQEGFIAGFLAGPPCETWSIARGKKVSGQPTGTKAPRIIRTEEHLWGLPSLALKELLQIAVGNELLTFTLLVACVMVQTGGIGIVEHPAEPTEENAASIWKLPIVQALLAAPGVTRRRVAQGLFGAPSPKPTDLMVINLPDLPLELRRWMTRTELPKGKAIGLNKEGKWQTGFLKEYPPAFCGALATAIRCGLDGIPVVEKNPPSAEDLERWRVMNQTQYSDHLGADYAR